LIDPYPVYRNIHRMVGVQIHDDTSTRPGGRDFFQTAEFLDYQSQMTSFDAVIAGGGDGSALYTGPDGVEEFNGALLSANTFEVIGVEACSGGRSRRRFRPGAPPVCVMVRCGQTGSAWIVAHRPQPHARWMPPRSSA
jgi:hypothetical protein